MTMELSEGQLVTRDGLKLYRRSWCANRPAARIILVHGLGEHCARYDHVGEFLAAEGFSLHGYDQRGFGRSPGRRGHCNRFGDYLSDLDLLIDAVAAEEPPLPTVLYGHSFGGLVVLAYGLAHPDKIAGIIASGPALGVGTPVPKWKSRLAGVLDSVMPTLAMPAGLASADLARNPEVGRKYDADPLVEKKVTVRYYQELVRAMADTNARASEFRVPLLLVQGSADRLVSPAAAIDWFTRAGGAVRVSGEKALKVYDGFYHELHNEDDRARLFADLKAWLARFAEEQ